MTPDLPIEPVLPDVLAALRERGVAVLQAPPGAGKTTRVPLYLLEHGLTEGRILMLEPRRVAARAAAARLADSLGAKLGGLVGYSMRGETRRSRETRIEVVTEGVLTRMLQSSPDLDGVGCVIFDEFHERALQADLGLALCLEVQAALRDDLKILVMSATLDAEPVAALLGDAPLVTSQGRAFEVETIWLDAPVKASRAQDYANAMARLVERALAETTGGVLVFLPGKGEISRVSAALNLPDDVTLMPLHGSLPFREQRAVLTPLETGRKLVLATAIAETSITVPDVRVVVDGGRSREARFDPASGMSRLVTGRVTKAQAEQRRGRAGRVAEGWCYRFWTKGEEGAMQAFPLPEIMAADLAPLALDLAGWGVNDPGDLAFLTQPPEGALSEARSLLRDLGMLDDAGRITAHGQEAAKVPAHPRLAHMLLAGGPKAAGLAALVSSRGPDRQGADLSAGLARLTGDAAREEVRLRKFAGADAGLSPGGMLALAYPDRVALLRPGDGTRYLLSGGAGAVIDAGDALAGQRLLVASDLDGDRREARIRAALPISESELRQIYAERLHKVNVCEWSRRERKVVARSRLMLGALALEDQHWREVDSDALLPAFLDGVRDLGLEALNWTKSARLLRARALWLGARGAELADMGDAALLEGLENWLGPWLAGMRSFGEVRGLDLTGPLDALLGVDGKAMLDRLAPAKLTVPTGSRLAVDYSAEPPKVEVRLQEVFGLDRHPTLGPDKMPVALHLLSPAGRPVQVTSDLPGFWRSSYSDVRKDMRGRYPRHPWPEDPVSAAPTRRAKPRGT